MIVHGDCVEGMAALQPCSIDAVVCDPPYELGFMGRAWDKSGVAYRPETWTAVLRVLKPGGHLLAFGGTRTYHRLACAVEDAGLEIRDQLQWLYGQGFPKSRNVGDGWGTALKPAHEPVVMARKPFAGTVAGNVAAHGVGALNVDGCRIRFASEADERESKEKNRHADFGSGPRGNEVYNVDLRDRGEHGNYDAPGRWPANVMLDEEAARMLDAQTGDLGRSSGGSGARSGLIDGDVYGEFSGENVGGNAGGLGDRGGASRFFYCAKASRSERDAGLGAFEKKPMLWSSGEQSPGTFQAEGTERAARNPHATVKPIELMRWLCRLVTPAGGLVLDPFAGSGSTGCAAALEGFEFLGFELDAEYVKIAEARIAHWRAQPVQQQLGL